MRMWRLDPRMLCNKHLLGNHGELHKHLHNFQKKHSMTGRIYPKVLIEPKSIKADHDSLAQEMLRRGMNHNSPLEQPDISYLPVDEQEAIVDAQVSISDLKQRCSDCSSRIDNFMVTDSEESQTGFGKNGNTREVETIV